MKIKRLTFDSLFPVRMAGGIPSLYNTTKMASLESQLLGQHNNREVMECAQRIVWVRESCRLLPNKRGKTYVQS